MNIFPADGEKWIPHKLYIWTPGTATTADLARMMNEYL